MDTHVVVCFLTFGHEQAGFWISLSVLVLLLIFGLLYGPRQIVANGETVTVKTYVRNVLSIPVSEIESIELFQPTMGAYRLFASGGYLGYWGLFREGDIGRYVAYYGRSSDCFLIRMKDGRQYVLGCEKPDEMVKYISAVKPH